MPSRSKSITAAVAAAGVVAIGAAASPAAATPAKPHVTPKPTCSTQIVQGQGSYHPPNIAFSYDLAGPACRDAVYTLIVRNIYNPFQWAFYAQRGNGVSTQISFVKPLPFTPTESPDAGNNLGSGLCVTAIVIRHGRVAYLAPHDEPCLLLSHGDARAFH